MNPRQHRYLALLCERVGTAVFTLKSKTVSSAREIRLDDEVSVRNIVLLSVPRRRVGPFPPKSTKNQYVKNQNVVGTMGKNSGRLLAARLQPVGGGLALEARAKVMVSVFFL